MLCLASSLAEVARAACIVCRVCLMRRIKVEYTPGRHACDEAHQEARLGCSHPQVPLFLEARGLQRPPQELWGVPKPAHVLGTRLSFGRHAFGSWTAAGGPDRTPPEHICFMACPVTHPTAGTLYCASHCTAVQARKHATAAADTSLVAAAWAGMQTAATSHPSKTGSLTGHVKPDSNFYSQQAPSQARPGGASPEHLVIVLYIVEGQELEHLHRTGGCHTADRHSAASGIPSAC